MKLEKKLSDSLSGKSRNPLSEDHKKKISKSMTGNIHSPETLEKIKNSNKGKHRCDKTKEKMKLSKLGKKRGPYKIKPS